MYKITTTPKIIRLSTATTLQSGESIYNYILGIDGSSV
jgi:hypothetical protein